MNFNEILLQCNTFVCIKFLDSFLSTFIKGYPSQKLTSKPYIGIINIPCTMQIQNAPTLITMQYTEEILDQLSTPALHHSNIILITKSQHHRSTCKSTLLTSATGLCLYLMLPWYKWNYTTLNSFKACKCIFIYFTMQYTKCQ